MPFPGAPYAVALTEGALRLKFHPEEGSFAVSAHESQKPPVCTRDYGAITRSVPQLADLTAEFFALDTAPAENGEALKGRLRERVARDPALRRAVEEAAASFSGKGENPDSWRQLDGLISRQHWRPAHYRAAQDALNYRRFFIVSDLAGLRIEADDVFDAAHKVMFELIAEGWIEGLRIDHIDGLVDPRGYCLKLRQRAPRPIYLVVEKIVAPDEVVPGNWDVEGTTGYEFANLVNGLLVDPRAEAPLSDIYRRFTDIDADPGEITRQAKIDIMDREMATELESLSQRLQRVAQAIPQYSDLTRNAVRKGLRQVVASLPVYRVYLDGSELSDSDRRAVIAASEDAEQRTPWLEPEVFAFRRALMLGEIEGPEAREVVPRIQQYTGPVMAKGLEDTALYRTNRLISLSDVGSRPELFSTSVEAFHQANRERLRGTPYAMLTTSSHDTKRGEDNRARIAALSGRPQEWEWAVTEWQRLLAAAGAPEIDPNELYYLFQTLIGVWPPEYAGIEKAGTPGWEEFVSRVTEGMLKAIREARVNTDWVMQRSDYEEAVTRTIDVALGNGAFLSAFTAFEAQIGEDGMRNGLVEAALKLTVPGVPDTYQGAELWEQSLVDPDNRRVVDFDARRQLLADVERRDWSDLLRNWREGGVKLRLTARILQLRKEREALFRDGDYLPVEAGEGVCAFQRSLGDESMLVAVRLFSWRESPTGSVGVPEGRWRDILTEREISGAVEAPELFAELPVAVLVRS